MAHEIHTSERRSFRGCRRRWNWAYRDGYLPTVGIRPLEFGVAYHRALESVYDPLTWDKTNAQEKLALAVEIFTTECLRQRDAFLIATGQSNLDEADGDDYEERVSLGIGMLDYHMTVVHPKYDTWFKPVMTEVAFEVPIADPDTDV